MDSHTDSVRAPGTSRPRAPVLYAELTGPGVTAHQPPDVAALLRTIATIASGFTELLDVLRTHYPAAGLDDPDPVAAALDQAAAAASDLRGSVESAANTIANRAPDDQWRGLCPGNVRRDVPQPAPMSRTERTYP